MAFNFLRRKASLEAYSDQDVDIRTASVSSPEFGGYEPTLASAEYGESGQNPLYDKLIKWVVYVAAFLLPLFFLPFTSGILELNKQILLLVLAGVGLILWLVKVVSSGRLSWRSNPVDKGVLAFLGSVVLATIFSLSKFKSLFGLSSSSSNSLVSILAFTIIYFLAVNVFEDKGRVLKKLFGISLAVALLYGLLQMFGWYILRTSFAASKAFNTVGSLNALGILAAIALPFLAKTKISFFKYLDVSKIGLALALLLLVLLNWWVLWLVAITGMVALIVLENIRSDKFRISRFLLPMTVIVLGVFLMVVNFNLSSIKKDLPIEVAPSFSLSAKVSGSVLKDNLIFGYGPENYSLAFDKFGAGNLANTTLSSLRFFDSVSETLNVVAYGGLVSSLAFLFLIVCLAMGFVKSKDKLKEDGAKDGTGVIAMLIATILAMFFYPFNTTLMLVFYLALALTVLALWGGSRRTFNVEDKVWLSLSSSLGFITGLILVLVGVYYGFSIYMGDVKYGQAVTSKDNQTAANKLIEAINWNGKSDIYYRAASQVAIGLLNEEANKKYDKPEDKQQQSTKIQNYIQSSVQLATTATQLNPLEASNWANLGDIYQSLLGVVSGVDKLSIDSYNKAVEKRPGDASYYVSIGDVYSWQANFLSTISNPTDENKKSFSDALAGAEDAYKKAVSISSDYGLAIYNLGKIYDAEGKTDEAIKQLEKVAPANSNQAGLAFELGLLYYRAGQKDKALGALQQAVLVSPDYSNARWYLALLYEERKDYANAIDQLNKILSLDANKDNSTVLAKLADLQKGQAAAAKITDQKPLAQ